MRGSVAERGRMGGPAVVYKVEIVQKPSHCESKGRLKVGKSLLSRNK